MSVVIRDATDAEKSTILPVVAASWSEYAEAMAGADGESMRDSLAGLVSALIEDARIFVAELDGRLAGAVAYHGPGRSDGVIFPREWASIRLLSVIPEARGLGLGRLLMERCVATARSDGAAIIGLHTDERMVVARGLYDRMGFILDADLPPKHSVNRWRFRLALSEESAGVQSDGVRSDAG